jgi:hypothetical protein
MKRGLGYLPIKRESPRTKIGSRIKRRVERVFFLVNVSSRNTGQIFFCPV